VTASDPAYETETVRSADRIAAAVVLLGSLAFAHAPPPAGAPR
jgi:hypothetical protein